MTSCTIIISHYESLPFLHACIRQIRKYKHPEIEQVILISDQSCLETQETILSEYHNNKDIGCMISRPFYSGYGVDMIMRYYNIKTDYVCQIHVDAAPISKQWLALPIKLIEEYNLSFVGQLQFINIDSSIYPPNPFFAMAQCFNVARTSTYKEMSMEAGFTRFHNRPQSGLTFNNDDWGKWAAEDYAHRGSDDDVAAFHWQDKYKSENKLGLAVTGYIQSSFGRIIEDLIFHFGSCRESIGVIDLMPDLYREYTKKINENYSDYLIEEMIELAKANRPPELEILSRNYWDGELKKSFPPTDELNKRIEQLKHE